MKDDLKFLGCLAAAYYFLFSLVVVIDDYNKRENISELKEKVQRYEQKISELKEVQKSSVKLISELASKSR